MPADPAPGSDLPASTGLPAMDRALALARSFAHRTTPNPSVGCVITDAGGRILGEGHTQPVGGPHAEIVALRDAADRGHDVRGATVHVTLEPCAHRGRTGPCCDALVAAGVGRVVASLQDPNPQVGGRGFERLRAAGIAVEVGPGAAQARAINLGFFSRMQRGTPWVRMKVAASLDGTTALLNGRSQWITSEAARADGHAWRARACAVLTGIGTVLSDDPRLDVRLYDTPRQPRVVVVDSRLQLSPDARLLQVARPALVYTTVNDPGRIAALEARGATVVVIGDAGGKVDLAAMLHDLAAREINELHMEAGYKLNGSFVREGLVDEFLVYLAPLLLGSGQGLAALGPFEGLEGGLRLHWQAIGTVGSDLRLLARIPGRDAF